ncbi:hypothetical protein BSKO_01566 [Bryopsis sp. KO-2023]|nr:hypothetical protein BSKO_01566 [Bryopsis sp. KO-2023]
MAISRLSILILSTLALAYGADIKYSDLAVGGHVVDLGMKLSFSDNEQNEAVPYNDGKPCNEDACQSPTFSNEDGTVLLVQFSPPADLKDLVMKKFDGAPVGAPVSIQFKACYTKKWTVNRKWRKAKDVIKKDKRCSKKMGTISVLADQNSTLSYILPSDTATAQWFITAYVKCGEDEKYCAIDTTGGISALVPPPVFAENSKVSVGQAKKDLGKIKTSQDIIYSTEVVESRQPALFAAVIILSCLSVGLLVGFFVFEQIARKNK